MVKVKNSSSNEAGSYPAESQSRRTAGSFTSLPGACKIKSFEEQYNLKLPKEYTAFLMQCGDGFDGKYTLNSLEQTVFEPSCLTKSLTFVKRGSGRMSRIPVKHAFVLPLKTDNFN